MTIETNPSSLDDTTRAAIEASQKAEITKYHIYSRRAALGMGSPLDA
jgi:hypothetical protein